MTTSEWISVIALVISTGAFSLQARSWLASGPRLRLHLMADAISFPRVDNDPKLALFVINRGDTPTTITHMVLYSYRSRWAKFRRKTTWEALVHTPNVPAEVGVNKQWTGIALYEKDMPEARAKGHLYVGVIASHSNRDFLIKVPPRKPDIPKDTVGGRSADARLIADRLERVNASIGVTDAVTALAVLLQQGRLAAEDLGAEREVLS
jgi:hypothetical protein